MNNGATDVAAKPISKLAELRERKQKRDEEEKKAQEALELQELELEEKLVSELGGRRGVKFEIVRTDTQVFAVKAPEYIVAKQFNAKENKTDEDIATYVRPCVIHPQGPSALEGVIMSNGGVVYRLANAVTALYKSDALIQSGKF